MYTKETIPRIEEALGLKLYDNQIKYILGEIEHPNYDNDRGTGKTTAYCIKLALSPGPPLDLRNPGSFSDAFYSVITNGRERYSRGFFVPMFMHIREQLSTYGFKVRDISYPRRTTGGFIVGN